MIAEINSWSVTFSGAVDEDDGLLCTLALVAKERNIRFGSVSILATMVPKGGEPPVPPYIWFPYFDEKDACHLLAAAGIPLEKVTFV